MSVFKIEDLMYQYDDGDHPVFSDINLSFEKGKVYAIVGRSGTGKTTLLSLLSGLDTPTGGRILYNDQDISKISQDEYRSNNVGVIFQSFNLLPHLNAKENVELSMDISKVKFEDKKKRAFEVLEKVGLNEEKALRRVLRLSGGEQQRVAIARALSYNPDVILADEPTGNLDKQNEKQIMNIFTSLAKNDNKCVIIVTHSDNVSEHVDEVFDLEKYKYNVENKKIKNNKNTK